MVLLATLGLAQEVATDMSDDKQQIIYSKQRSEILDDQNSTSSRLEVASTVGAAGIVVLTGLTIITLPLRLFKD